MNSPAILPTPHGRAGKSAAAGASPAATAEPGGIRGSRRPAVGDVTAVPDEIDGVAVVHGADLAGWLEDALRGEALSPDAVTAVWRKIQRHVRLADAKDLARSGPPPKLALDVLRDGIVMLVGALVGVLVGLWGATAIGGSWGVAWLFGVSTCGWLFRRRRFGLWFGTGWLAGTAALAVAVGVRVVAVQT